MSQNDLGAPCCVVSPLIFPVKLTTYRIGNLILIRLIHTLAICVTIHIYIHNICGNLENSASTVLVLLYMMLQFKK